MTGKQLGEQPANASACEGYVQVGLTKREAFAMAAMQGMLGNQDYGGTCETIAKDAVKFADALLDELTKERV